MKEQDGSHQALGYLATVESGPERVATAASQSPSDPEHIPAPLSLGDSRKPSSQPQEHSWEGSIYQPHYLLEFCTQSCPLC